MELLNKFRDDQRQNKKPNQIELNGQDDDQDINDEWSELNHYPGTQFRGENEEVMKEIATKEIDGHVFDTNNIETSWQFKKK